MLSDIENDEDLLIDQLKQQFNGKEITTGDVDGGLEGVSILFSQSKDVEVPKGVFWSRTVLIF